MEPVNLKTLAERLNLSISTVSKALNDSYEITAETKKKVLALAQELNYQPNPFASSLRRHKSKTIAVILPEIANNFFALAINGIEAVAVEHGYHVLIYLTHEDYNREVAITQLLLNGRVDGVLMSLASTTENQNHLLELRKKDLPIVFFDRVSEDDAVSKVTTDDFESGYNATQHLVDQGCRRIAHLMFPGHLSIGRKRRDGYLQALLDNNLPNDPALILSCNNNSTQNYNAILDLLKSNNRPDGIFASIEKLALNTYAACAELNLSIPDDVKLISFSNLETAQLLHPSLTTITQPAYDIGKEAATLLFKALKRKPVGPETAVLKSVLIKRNSTAIRSTGNV